MLPFSRSTAHAPMSTPMTASPRRRMSALAAAAVLAVSAAGCSSGGASAGASASGSVDPYDVAASVQASQSATASVSLSPEDAALREAALAMQAPEKPARMGENSPEGAVAAAEYFISLYPYVYATGDLTEWDAMSEEGCVFCGSVHDNVTELHESGGWADPGTAEIDDASYESAADGFEYSAVTIAALTSPNQLHDPASSSSAQPVRETPSAPTESTITVAIRYSGLAWSIGGVETQ